MVFELVRSVSPSRMPTDDPIHARSSIAALYVLPSFLESTSSKVVGRSRGLAVLVSAAGSIRQIITKKSSSPLKGAGRFRDVISFLIAADSNLTGRTESFRTFGSECFHLAIRNEERMIQSPVVHTRLPPRRCAPRDARQVDEADGLLKPTSSS
jgi:hypothetical protein